MRIEKILQQLEAQIARLQQARDLLAGSAVPPKRSTRARARRAAMESQPEAPALQPAPAPEAPAAEKVARIVPPKRERNRPRAPRKASVASAPMALTSSVPTGPVAVSATAAKSDQARRVNVDPVPAKPVPANPGERTLASLIAKLPASADASRILP